MLKDIQQQVWVQIKVTWEYACIRNTQETASSKMGELGIQHLDHSTLLLHLVLSLEEMLVNILI